MCSLFLLLLQEDHEVGGVMPSCASYVSFSLGRLRQACMTDPADQLALE